MLKDGGKFYPMDVFYSFDMVEYETFFDNWIEGARQAAGDELAQDAQISIRDEYMTVNWIIEELLTRTGSHIEKADYHEGFIAAYQCTKMAD